MEVVSLDPYEQKLFQMFQSHDTTNTGLDETALIKLCNSLELSDHSNVLVESLLSKTQNNTTRIDFISFKEALLNFLGTEMGDINESEKALTFNENDESKTSKKPLTKNGPVSPSREISPKLIMGTKKYGRRSRPQSIATDSSLSETDEEIIAGVPKSSRVQRSSSHSDMHNNTNNRSRRRPANVTNTKLKRCASLPVQRRNFHAKTYGKDQHPLEVQPQIKLEPDVKTSAKDQKQLTSSVESLGNIDFENLSHTINNVWSNYTKESQNDVNDECLQRDQLEYICTRIGLFHNVAGKMADEVFEKLNLNPAIDRISFDQFIGLLNAGPDTDDHRDFNADPLTHHDDSIFETSNNENSSAAAAAAAAVGGGAAATARLNSSKNYNFNFDPIESVHSNAQDSLCTLVDTTANNRDLHVQDLPMQLDTVPSNSVIEMWENATVQEPKMLLSNLGFDDDEVNVEQLIKVLEEELRGLHGFGETQTTLLKSLLALEKAQIAVLQQSFRQLCEENKKLHADNRDANKRAALLAQETDERQANLENSTKTEIRLLEQRHAEVIRDLTSQIALDRENWSNLNLRLESRIKSLESDEQRLKMEMQTLKDENSALDKDQTMLQKQITELLENNIKLNNDIMSMGDKKSFHAEVAKEADELLELMEKITTLQFENNNLRDKNDELTTELENTNMELVKLKMSSKKSNRSSSANMSDSTNEILSDDADHASCLAMKRRGDSPSKAKLTEESPRTGKLRKCNNDGGNNSESDTSGEWVALNSELNVNALTGAASATTTTSGFSQDFSSINTNDTNKDDEIKMLREKISSLELEINDLKTKSHNEKSTTTESASNTISVATDVYEKVKLEKEEAENRCKDLEISLEQMQKAYEECEDYWQNKLNEERQIFERERQIYEDEQHESDKKFADLMEKVREYEDQYSKDGGRLSPIEEKDTLEQQYMELEAEIEEMRHNAKLIFEEKAKEIDDLNMNIQELKLRLGDSVDITQVCMGSSQQMVTDKVEVVDSPASSPISYLWNQSTIQAPARDYQNPNWNRKNTGETSRIENLTTSETSIFSTPIVESEQGDGTETVTQPEQPQKSSTNIVNSINPIQKPSSMKSSRCQTSDESSSSTSRNSYDTSSSQSSSQQSSLTGFRSFSSANGIKEELKRLKFFEIQLRQQIKDLTLQRDSLVMELQQLQEAKPVLQKAYARAAHPSLIQRVHLLEHKNRYLQNQLRQQQQYTDSILQQTWHQQRAEIADLHNRLESQSVIMAEQLHRLTNSDILIKDLYVENSHLAASVQRLEQQRNRANVLHQQQFANQPTSFSGLPGLP